MEKQIIPDPEEPKGCVFLNKASSYPHHAFRLYVMATKYLVIAVLADGTYCWWDEVSGDIWLRELSDNIFESFIHKSFESNYILRIEV